jgi:hypothetical protein
MPPPPPPAPKPDDDGALGLPEPSKLGGGGPMVLDMELRPISEGLSVAASSAPTCDCC